MKILSSKIAQVVALAVVLAGIAASALGQQANRYSLHLNNYSGLVIDHVYVSQTSDGFWNDDLLGDDVLSTPGTFDVTNILPGRHYDVKLVDEDGDPCVLRNVYFDGNKFINISHDWLIGCEIRTYVA